MPGTVIIAGALGLVGRAALDRYVADGWDVIGLSRRAPPEGTGARFLSVDLTDAAACRQALSGLGATHLVYAALYDKPELRAGWLDTEQMETNRRMLANCASEISRGAARPGISAVVMTMSCLAMWPDTSSACARWYSGLVSPA